MAKTTHYQFSVTSIERVRSSRNGNPRFEISGIGEAFYTAPDTSAAYEVENDFGRASEQHPIAAILTLDGRRNVIDWEIVK